MSITSDKKDGSRTPNPETSALKARVFGKLFAAKVVCPEVGRGLVFALATAALVLYAISVPLFGFSDTWLIATMVMFLMVVLIQMSKARDSAAIQMKLDKIIRFSRADVGLEELTDQELAEIAVKKHAAIEKSRNLESERIMKHKLRVIDGGCQPYCASRAAGMLPSEPSH
jgi:low affinity Fe/Cu permease